MCAGNYLELYTGRNLCKWKLKNKKKEVFSPAVLYSEHEKLEVFDFKVAPGSAQCGKYSYKPVSHV